MLNGKKTYIVSIIAFIMALCTFMLKWIEEGIIEPTAVVLAFISLALLFLRKGMNNTGVK